MPDNLFPLTKTEIRAAALPYVFSTHAQRDREIMVEEVLRLDAEGQARIETARRKKIEEAERRQAERPKRKKRQPSRSIKRTRSSADVGRSLTEHADTSDSSSDSEAPNADTTPSPFMKAVPESVKKQCLQDFIDATSNAALKHEVCVICAREMWANEGDQWALKDIPNSQLLVPETQHKAHELWHGLLLLVDKIQEAETDDARAWCCSHCTDALKVGRLPKFSLANGMWIGNAPPELEDLTVPEQMLVALHYPRCFIFKLYAKDGGRHYQKPEELQSSLKGNVTSFELSTDDVTRMLEGELMPRSTRILPSLISVSFVGQGKLNRAWLKSTFQIRRRKVHAALVWLKENHPSYAELSIDEGRLSELPEEGIPEELLATTRVDSDEGAAAQEQASYVPQDDDEEDWEEKDKGLNSEATTLKDNTRSEDNTFDEFAAGEPDVIPLQFLGTSDADISRVTTQELLEYALSNLSEEDEGPYAVRHGGRPANTFGKPHKDANEEEKARVLKTNPMVAAFPILFPYGIGGIEAPKRVAVNFTEHVRWALQYHDRRFRTHHSFPFVAFGIEQKRQALGSARLQISRRDFERDAADIMRVTVDDLKEAADQEARGERVTNASVQKLKKHLTAMSGRVLGSDQARASNRSKIWSTCVMKNPPNLWITINPADIHDPIAQIFAGEDIDMDKFIEAVGPDKDKRARNVAKDPFAAAKFYDFIVKTLFKTLFRVDSSGYSLQSGEGVLGSVAAYFGVTEAQGRGTLHLHLIVWLEGSPTTEEMSDKLKDARFREKVENYLKANVQGHLDGFTGEGLRAIVKDKEVPYSRPPCATQEKTVFEDARRQFERRVVRASQVHTCKKSTCLRYLARRRAWRCKRKAPFPLSEHNMVDELGRWKIRRTYGYLNNWHPWIAIAMRCNHDIKLLTNGRETRDIIWYVTTYATKKQQKSYNMSALLARKLQFHFGDSKYLNDMRERNRLMLFRCLHALNSESEKSGPQVISYLMGWNDTFTSHNYVSIYWSSVESHIRRTTAEFAWRRSQGADLQAENSIETEQVEISVDSLGRLVPRSQVEDYQKRGTELESYSYLSFQTDTWESKLSEQDRATQQTAVDRGVETPRRRGRPRQLRSFYHTSHPKHETRVRVVRTTGHKTLPNFVGRWFPKREKDNEDFFGCCMLALLKPWRTLNDLKGNHASWSDAFQDFTKTCQKRDLDIVSNIQLYHRCREAANEKSDSDNSDNSDSGDEDEALDRGRNQERKADQLADDSEDDGMVEDSASLQLTEEGLRYVLESQEKPKEVYHGRVAVDIGRHVKMFDEEDEAWPVEGQTATHVEGDRRALLEKWRTAMKEDADRQSGRTRQDVSGSSADNQLAGVEAIQDRQESQDHGEPAVDPDPQVENRDNNTLGDDLHVDQKRAFQIIEWHAKETFQGKEPPQLLMQIQGEPGTGKSKVIRTISEFFAQQGQDIALLRAAHTGIAASIIDGKTLHGIIMSGINVKMPSEEKLGKLAAFWDPVKYLIIDEISMVSKDFFAKLSRILGLAKQRAGSGKSHLPFGGVNVIIVGDFHQFPPVAAKPLYWGAKENADPDSDEVYGNELYKLFKTVVILKDQVRVTDEVWVALLQKARVGQCGDEELKSIRTLVLTSQECPETDFEDGAWSDAVLVTPRHSVRTQWNTAATRRHCRRGKAQLFRCKAEDRIGDKRGRDLSLEERWAIGTKRGGKDQEGKNKNGLADEVEIAIGMKVMVTYNVETELAVANGARGTVVDIVLDENEPEYNREAAEVQLLYPPAYVLVRLERSKAKKLEGLDDGVVPIEPMDRSFQVKLPVKGKFKTVHRRQLPLTPAYAFTDCRAQGQTLGHVIVDIGPVPSGSISGFNAYVALSRSSGRETIRLLRDFDDILFTKPACERLIDEDNRLETLNDETRQTWNLALG